MPQAHLVILMQGAELLALVLLGVPVALQCVVLVLVPPSQHTCNTTTPNNMDRIGDPIHIIRRSRVASVLLPTPIPTHSTTRNASTNTSINRKESEILSY